MGTKKKADPLELIERWHKCAAPMPMRDILDLAADEIRRLRATVEKLTSAAKVPMKTKLEQLRSLMDGVGDLQLGQPGDEDHIMARRLIEWAVNVIQDRPGNIAWLQRMRNLAYEAEAYTRKKCTERLDQMQLQLYRMKQAVDAHQKGLKRAQVREQRAKQELAELRKKLRNEEPS